MKTMTTRPEDACDNWDANDHPNIASNETEIGALCNQCMEQYVADKLIDENGRVIIHCPRCGEPIWDRAEGSKLNKCWNCKLAFD